MGEISDRLGGRSPGELVRSADWNALVDEVDQLATRLVEAVAALSGRLADLGTQVGVVRDEHAKLRGTVDGILARHLDVRLSTTRARYAIGERAELRAEVANLDGAPLPTPRPWVDFVTVWGRLRPLDGGGAVIGAEGRSLSVQVDADGVARAQLVAEAAEDLPEEVQTGFEVALQTRVAGAQDSIANVLLDANTPAEAARLGVFGAVSEAYDRPSEPHVQAYADAYVLNTPVLVDVPTLPIITTRWRDLRATVLAIVKPDTDPTTPDAALGSASLQVTFRDWLSPWIVLDYLDLPETPDFVIRDRLLDGITEDFADSLQGVTTQIAGIVEDRGVLGRLKSLQLVDQALGTLEGVAGQPPFIDTLAATVQQAVRVQQALEPAQAAVATEVGRQPGIDALVQTTARSTGDIGALQATVAAVSEELEVLGRSTGEVTAGLQAVRETVSNLDGKVTVAVDRDFTRLSNEVADLAGQLVEVERLYPEPVKETLLDFHSKLLKVDQLEEAVNELRR